jgi:hypothetical protein
MQELHFGTIENQLVRGCEPCSTPAPKITQEIKLGTDAPPRHTAENDNFALKRQVTDLFDQFDHLPDGSLVTIEVRHGLPARLIVAR